MYIVFSRSKIRDSRASYRPAHRFRLIRGKVGRLIRAPLQCGRYVASNIYKRHGSGKIRSWNYR